MVVGLISSSVTCSADSVLELVFEGEKDFILFKKIVSLSRCFLGLMELMLWIVKLALPGCLPYFFICSFRLYPEFVNLTIVRFFISLLVGGLVVSPMSESLVVVKGTLFPFKLALLWLLMTIPPRSPSLSNISTWCPASLI